jgi:hypothetical protein
MHIPTAIVRPASVIRIAAVGQYFSQSPHAVQAAPSISLA